MRKLAQLSCKILTLSKPQQAISKYMDFDAVAAPMVPPS